MKDQHGHVTENTVELLCHKLFGRDYVLRSPKLIEPSGSKELTDVLIIIDDTAVVIQSKSLKIDISDLDPTKFNRIRKRQEQAKQQFNTTLNALARGANVCGITSLDVAFDVDWSLIKKKVGIITLNLPDDRYNDPEFRFQYPCLVEEHNNIMVHTFLVNDLMQMTLELTTPADVLFYLMTREKCLMSDKFVIGNELDFLAFFKTQYPKIEKALSDPDLHLWVAPGFWEGYRKSHMEDITNRDDRFKSSMQIDRLIRQLRTSVEYSAQQYGLTPQESAINYLRLIGKIGKLSRMERVQIGNKLVSKVEKTRSKKWGYFVYESKQFDTGYVFLLINEDDREKRQNFLQNLCVEACHKVTCSELVGIATGGAQQQHSTTDALIMNVAEVRETTEPNMDFQLFQQPIRGTINEWDTEAMLDQHKPET